MRTHVISSRLFLFSLLCTLFLAACGSTTTDNSTSASPTARPVVDSYGTPITLPTKAPQRIISLAPSVSEILGALHLQKKVVGVDAFTDYPSDLASLPKVSDENGINTEKIVALKPDLILSNQQFSKPVYTNLKSLGLNVIDLPAANIQQTEDQIIAIGRITFTSDAAGKIVADMQKQIKQAKDKVAGTVSSKVLLEVDDSTPGKPYVFGGGSFGDELVEAVNANNIFHSNTANGGYPQVTDEAVIAANPQYVILTELTAYGGNPDDVYKRPNWDSIEAVKSHHVYRINSNIIQRPGPRLSEAVQCLAQMVHPDKFSGSLPAVCTATI